jgi:hypothetical protein
MMKSIVIAVLVFVSTGSFAQLYDGAISVELNFSQPLSDKEYIDNSATGARMTYTRFFSKYLGAGLDISYTTYDDYVPRQTYYYDGGAVTTDLFPYHYYLTIGGRLVYRMKPDNKFTPYGAIGLGAAVSDYKLFYNVYQEQDSKTGFLMRPEAGVMYLFKEYGSLGVKASVAYDYAFNESEYFGVKNFSSVGFQIGILLLN